ncbi:MAG: Ig-like domain-containing protein [Gemmatimonadaceae bacterium]|nr:Ig-like domain-containing protein [Gemmatimonadaceae bacterium]
MGTAFRRLASRILVVTPLAVFAACGGGGDAAAPRIVATVDVSPSLLNLVPGQTTTLTATAHDAAGIPISGKTATWSSSNPSVLTVSAVGVATAITDGIASISATIDGKVGGAAATVRTPVASVTVTPATAELFLGGAPLQLTAVPKSPAGAAIAGRTVTWASASPTIASVSSTGLVTGVAAGAANITATADGIVGSATIQVSPNPCNVIRAVAVGQTLSGTLVANDCKLSDSTAIQRYEFTVTAPTKIEVLMTSSAVDAYLFLTDAALNVIDEDDDGGTGINARILRTIPAGRYFVIANTYNANTFGAYQLTVRQAPAACFIGRTTTLPSTIDASLSAASCLQRDESYEDRYDITVGARTTLTVNMTSTVLDPFLVVIDNAGRVVDQDDDSGAGLNASLEVPLEPGNYTILARGQPGQTGAYRLVVAPLVDPCAVTRTIAAGQVQSGTFAPGDCAISDGGGPNRYFQRYGLTLATTTAMQFDMTSGVVDAYLVIQNAQTGAVIAENDDASSQTTNARVLINLPAGQYIVNTTTYNAGEVGPYQLAAGSIQASGVTISVGPQNLSLQAGQSQQASSTVTGSANIAVTWQSSEPGVASITGTGVIRAITGGTSTITATSQADPSKTASLTVTVGASTGVTNLDIAALYLVQSVQQLDGRVPLVADRGAVARVFLRGNRTGLAAATVRLRILQGATVLGTFTGTATPTTTVDEGCCSANIVIPSTAIRTGISVLADVDPDNAVAESNEADNQFPLSGTAQSLNVVAVPPMNVRLIPVQQNRNGPVGAGAASLFDVFKSMWPLSVINATVRQPLVIDYTIGTQTFDDWGRLVRDVEILRQTEGGGAYYYGLVRTRGTSGVLGLANGIPARTAIGVDEGSDFGAAEAKLTFAHEMGHTLSLRHSPCGGAAGPEPTYPFADGSTGAYGMDTFNGNAIKLPNAKDVMTYCPNQWVSAFNYRKVMDFRQANPNGTGISAPTSVLMVSGGIQRGVLTVDPAFSVKAAPASNDANGRFVIEGFSADDKLLFSRRFNPYRVDDAEAEAFVIAVPVPEAVQAQVARLGVRELSGTGSLARGTSRRLPSTAGGTATLSTSRLPGAKLQMTWAPSEVPLVIVRDRVNGEVLAMLRNGTAELSQFGPADRVELLLSDGVKSTRATVDPITGAIRK